MNEDLSHALRPQARTSGLVIQQFADEVLIYDLERHQSHCLNPTAALIWKLCDGRRTLSDIARGVGERLKVTADEQIVRLALKQLGRRRLLGEPLVPQAQTISRRALVRRLGIAAVLLPLVTSVAVPTALASVSCSGACSNQNDCAPGCICIGGSCMPA